MAGMFRIKLEERDGAYEPIFTYDSGSEDYDDRDQYEIDREDRIHNRSLHRCRQGGGQ